MINEELVRKVIAEVLQEVAASENVGSASVTARPSAPAPAVKAGISMEMTEKERATRGTDAREVVVAIPPAFGTEFDATIVDVSLADVLRQVFAGIEEQGLSWRLVRVYHTADVAFIAHQAAKLSGSGVGIGIISRGTTVIHQRDLAPLNNLELLPQSPLLDLETFRAIGRNAGMYAKGEQPVPVATKNDPMARPKFQGIAALLHNKEVKALDRSKSPMELQVRFR
ncbi:MAG: propanediol/glycerol family dehydratase medium subunit [Synergistota bacterium]|nr:propanediol/glycerol family dehydratase medium subunit [Synergistota bacterium]